jgi:hypothetical protein
LARQEKIIMPLHALTRPVRSSALVLALVTLTLAQAAAQQTRFTVDDLLDLANPNVADVTADGKFAVVTSAALRDRLGVNNSRYGDPSYIAPSVADVWVVETATGKRRSFSPTSDSCAASAGLPTAHASSFRCCAMAATSR